MGYVRRQVASVMCLRGGGRLVWSREKRVYCPAEGRAVPSNVRKGAGKRGARVGGV